MDFSFLESCVSQSTLHEHSAHQGFGYVTQMERDVSTHQESKANTKLVSNSRISDQLREEKDEVLHQMMRNFVDYIHIVLESIAMWPHYQQICGLGQSKQPNQEKLG